MIISILFFLLMFVLLIKFKKAKVAVSEEEVKKSKLPKRVYAFGFYVDSLIPKKKSLQEKEMQNALFKSEETLRIERVKTISIIFLCLILGAFISLVFSLKNSNDKPVEELTRPKFGESAREEIQVKGLSEDTEISISVSGRDPSEEEMEDIFQKVFERMKTRILGENESLLHVTANLDMETETEEGISLTYKSSNPEILSNRGLFKEENIEEPGEEIHFRVTLEYKDYKSEKEFSVRVYPVELSEKEKLLKEIQEADANTSSDDKLVLPTEIDGRKIQYAEKKESANAFFGLLIVVAVLLWFLPKERMKSAYKKRNREMEESYSTVVMKLKIFIHAGMSIRGAWFRVVEDYQKSLRDKKKKEYVYEEMLITKREISDGRSEEEAYLNFGRRAGSHLYLKLGNMLSQNVRQGISGLEKQFETEVSEAMETRKNQALRKGEEAETKLLFPMLLMLLVVLVTLTVPAFMSF